MLNTLMRVIFGVITQFLAKIDHDFARSDRQIKVEFKC